MFRPTCRALTALVLGGALVGAAPSHAVDIVLDGSAPGGSAQYDAIGDGWFFAGGPSVPPDGVGDAGGNMLAVGLRSGQVSANLEVRGIAEFPLLPLASVTAGDVVSATLTFYIDDVVGTFGPGATFDGTASDTIYLFGYTGNGMVDLADFGNVIGAPLGIVPTSGSPGSITDATLAVSGPLQYDVDVTALVQSLLTSAAPALGTVFATDDNLTATSIDGLSPPGQPGATLPFITVTVADPTTTTSTTTSTIATSSTISSTSTSTSSTSSTTVTPPTDHPQDAVRLLLKAKNGKEKLVWVSKTPALVFPATAPTVAGATLEVRNPVTLESSTIPMPAANWSVNGTNTVYKFKNTSAPGGPSVVKVSVFKSSVLKVVAKGTGITLDEATQGTVELVLTIGSDRYCAACSAATKDEGAAGPAGQFVAKQCPAPAVCP